MKLIFSLFPPVGISTLAKPNGDCTTEKLNTSTGHNLKWDNFDISARGKSDTHCKIKETLLIRDLKPTLNENLSSEKLYLYQFA